VRLSFVDHGTNFVTSENTMDKLVDKVKQIYDTYADENTYFERIALVGCAICCHGLGAIVIYLHFSYSARNFCIS
jgi:hypothetical protein